MSKPVAVLLVLLAALCFFVMQDSSQWIVAAFLLSYLIVMWISKKRFGRPEAKELPPLPEKISKKKDFQRLQSIALYEFEYIRETMAQAMNDRHTLINYFLLAAGVVITIISTLYDRNGGFTSRLSEVIISISFIFCFVGWIFLMKMIRLRQAWCDSCIAMNHIKNFFLINAELNDKSPQSPFLWKASSMPPPDQKGNIFHLEVILISFLSSLAIALVSFILQGYLWVWAPLFAGGFFIMLLSAYPAFLRNSGKSVSKNQEPTA